MQLAALDAPFETLAHPAILTRMVRKQLLSLVLLVVLPASLGARPTERGRLRQNVAATMDREAALTGVAEEGWAVRQDGSSAVARGGCHRGARRKSTLKLIKETAFAGLFRDLKNSTKFEASGLSYVRGKFYAVFDNAMALGVLDDRFSFRDPGNVLIGDWEPESQFEGIAYVPENDTFLLLHEAVESGRDEYKPSVREVRLRADMSGYDDMGACEVDFLIESSNKGFESIQYVHTPDGPFLLGLCEGNHCKGGEEGQDAGNGRIVVSQQQWDRDGACVWEPVKTISVPSGAYFRDYAAMAYNYQTQKLAVLSQEEAAIWVGDFSADDLEFKSQEGQVFHLPRDNHCEGIQWIDNYRVVVASDKAKSRQPYWCDAKDQSIHLFAMPLSWDPYRPASEAAARAAQEALEEAQEEEEDARGAGASEL